MGRIGIYFFLVLQFVSFNAFPQDSLTDKTFLELDRLAVETYKKGDTVLSKIYSKYQRNKAKAEGDSLEVAFSFYTYLLSDTPKTRLQYADSTIIYSLNSENKSYPTYGYLQKSRALYAMGKYEEALKNYLVAQDYARAKGNKSHISSVQQGLAMIKSRLGDYSEALQLYLKNHREIISTMNSKISKRNYPVSLLNLSHTYLNLKKLDSARYYARKGLQEYAHDKDFFVRFISTNSQIDYYSGNLNAAYDSMQKYLPRYTGNRLANNYYYSGKIKYIQGNDSLAAKYLQKADSIVTTMNHPFPEMKDAYQLLAELSPDDNIKLYYVEKYIWVDSLITARREVVSPIIEQKFDEPRMLEEKEYLLERISKNKLHANVLALITLLISGVAVYFFLKYKKGKIKSKELVQRGLKPISINKSYQKGNDDISPELYSRLFST